MSAFDNLKFAMIPTAWKNGRLYTAIPNDTTTTDFLSSSTLNGLSLTGLSDTTYPLYAQGTTGGSVRIDFTQTITSGARVRYFLRNGANTHGVAITDTNILSSNANGSGNFYIEADVTDGLQIRIIAESGVTATIDTFTSSLTQNGDHLFARGTSATRVYSSGLLQTITDVDAPRLDYTGGGAPGVLVESQRKNQFLYSNTSGSTQFNYNGGTGTLGFSSTLSSPDGSTTNSMELNPDGTSSQFWAGMGGNRYDVLTDQTVYTASCFVNYDNYRYVKYGGIFGDQSAVFDLEQETVVSQDTNVVSARVEPYYQNWKRIVNTFTFNDTVGNGIGYIVLRAMSDSTSHIFSPAPTLPMHSYGWQIEQASYPSSYIETTGTSVTRSKDLLQSGGYSELFNSSQGTLYIEVKVDEDFDGFAFIRIRDTNGQNVIDFYFQPNNLRTRQKLNNTFGAQNQIITEFVDSKGDFFKVATTYNSNGSRKIYFDGSQFFSGTNSGDFTTSTGFDLIDTTGSTPGFSIRGIYYFDRELTNSELVSLTT